MIQKEKVLKQSEAYQHVFVKHARHGEDVRCEEEDVLRLAWL